MAMHKPLLERVIAFVSLRHIVHPQDQLIISKTNSRKLIGELPYPGFRIDWRGDHVEKQVFTHVSLTPQHGSMETEPVES